MGQAEASCRWAGQCSRPKKMICKCAAVCGNAEYRPTPASGRATDELGQQLLLASSAATTGSVGCTHPSLPRDEVHQVRLRLLHGVPVREPPPLGAAVDVGVHLSAPTHAPNCQKQHRQRRQGFAQQPRFIRTPSDDACQSKARAQGDEKEGLEALRTGKAGTPNPCDTTTLAVLWPTPGSASSSSRERGTCPPWRSTICWERPWRYLALLGARPT